MQEEIIKEPNKTIYNIRFANLTDLYDYLKQNPVLNTNVFQSQHSLSEDIEFHG